MTKRHKIDLVVLALVLLAGLFAVRHAHAIGDWWHFRQYSPPDEVAKLAEDAGMNEEGKKLFYRFSPELISRQDLDAQCGDGRVGCIEGRKIYLLDHMDTAGYQRNIVSAAHEMLHAAYSRLSEAEKLELERFMEAELGKNASDVVSSKLTGYPPEDYYNEAHSFIGSEVLSIDERLETHYRRYFEDRSKSTAAYQANPL